MKYVLLISVLASFSTAALAGKITCNNNGVSVTVEVSDEEIAARGLNKRASAQDALSGNTPLQKFCNELSSSNNQPQNSTLLSNLKSKSEIKCTYEENNSGVLHCPDGYEYYRSGLSANSSKGINNIDRDDPKKLVPDNGKNSTGNSAGSALGQ